MNWDKVKAKLLPAHERKTGSFVTPSVVLDMQPGFVAGARLDRSSRQVRRTVVRRLDDGVLVPLPSRPNLTKPEVVRRVVREVLETVGSGGRLGILLPDSSVRVAILQFESVPGRREEAEALVRWKMSGILPFPSEEARVSFQVLSEQAKDVELLAIALRNSVVAEYESVFEELCGSPSLILPATMALLPLLPASPEGSHVLVHVCAGSVTTVVMAGDRIRFWRNHPVESHPEEGNGEVAQEIARVVATCRDNLKTEVGDLWIYVRPPATQLLNEEIGKAEGPRVHFLAGSALYSAALPPEEKEMFERFGMPFAGLLANRT